MNKLIVLILLFLSFNLFAQNKLEEFNKKTNSLVKIESVELGSIKGIKIKKVNYSDLITNEKMNGIKFEYEFTNSYKTENKFVLIDSSEIENLKKGLELLTNSTITPHTELKYKTINRCEFGCFFNKGVLTYYIQIKEFDKDSYLILSKEDLQYLSKLL